MALLTARLDCRTRKRFQTVRSLFALEGEAVPEREKRLRIARSTAGRGPEATIRLPDAPDRRKEEGLCPHVGNPRRRSGAAYESALAIITSPYAPRKGFITARSVKRHLARRAWELNNATGKRRRGTRRAGPASKEALIIPKETDGVHPSVHPVNLSLGHGSSIQDVSGSGNERAASTGSPHRKSPQADDGHAHIVAPLLSPRLSRRRVVQVCGSGILHAP